MSAPRHTQWLARDLAEHLQHLDTRFLLAIHHSDVDIARLAKEELMNRGLNGEGRWVGYAKAGELLGV